MGVTKETFGETICCGHKKVPARLDFDSAKPGAIVKAIDESDVVGTFRMSHLETKFNFITQNAKDGAEVHKVLGVDTTAVTGGGLLTDIRKGTGTTAENFEPVDACLSEGAVDIKKYVMPITVAFIMVGIVVEAMTNHATIDFEKACKPARADINDTFDAVAADFDTTVLTFVGSIVVIGTDVSMYVTEGHIIKGVRESLDTPYPKVTQSTLKNSCDLAVEVKSGQFGSGCEGTVSGQHTVGTGPLNAGSGTDYVTVYMSLVYHDILYGAVRVTSSLTVTEPNKFAAIKCSVEAVAVTGADIMGTSEDEVVDVVTVVAKQSLVDANTLYAREVTKVDETDQSVIDVTVDVRPFGNLCEVNYDDAAVSPKKTRLSVQQLSVDFECTRVCCYLVVGFPSAVR